MKMKPHIKTYGVAVLNYLAVPASCGYLDFDTASRKSKSTRFGSIEYVSVEQNGKQWHRRAAPLENSVLSARIAQGIFCVPQTFVFCDP